MHHNSILNGCLIFNADILELNIPYRKYEINSSKYIIILCNNYVINKHLLFVVVEIVVLFSSLSRFLLLHNPPDWEEVVSKLESRRAVIVSAWKKEVNKENK